MRWRLCILALAGALAYSNSLAGPFIFDDTVSIVDNASIRDGLASAAFPPPREVPTSGRPIVNASLAINYSLGGLAVRGYHIWNITVHIVCALLLFACTRLTLQGPTMPGWLAWRATDVAFGIALVWVLHPLNTEAVDYVTQRTESMMAAFYLLTIYTSARAAGSRRQAARGESLASHRDGRGAPPARRDPPPPRLRRGLAEVRGHERMPRTKADDREYRDSRKEQRGGVGRCIARRMQPDSHHRLRGLWQAAAVVSCAAGMGCKESMATAPIVVVLYDDVFVFGSLRRALRERWRFYGCLAATWLWLAFALSGGPRIRSAGFAVGVSPWTYLLNQTSMITRYLRLSLWPDSLVLHYGWPRALTLSDVLPSALFVLVLGLATMLALRWRPAIGFLGAWFFVTLAPASSIVPIATEVGAERRMYLPLMAVVALAGVGVTWATWRFERSRPIALALSLIIAVPLAATTFARNREYASPLVMAQTVLERWPTPLAESMVGQELAIAGRHDEAIAHLRAAAPGYPRARYHLGGELFNAGRIDEAMPELQAFVAAEPTLVEAVGARVMLSRGFVRRRQWPQAEEQLRLLLTMTSPADPTRTAAVGLLADTLFQEQRFDEAVSQYRAYLAARPADGGAATNLGIALAALGKDEDALAAFRLAVQINPRDVTARRNLELALESTRGR